jgi:hypothetical protein
MRHATITAHEPSESLAVHQFCRLESQLRVNSVRRAPSFGNDTTNWARYKGVR